MKKGNLKESLREHIESHSLSEHQLNALLKTTDEQPGKTVSLYRWTASFATLFIVLSVSFYFAASPQYTLDMRIGNEVAKNHIQLKPLEVKTSSIKVIREYFTELDFLPIESTLLKDSNKTLIGGRYCSIQGITAAQLRLRNKETGQVQSLYQTLYDPKIFNSIPIIDEDNKPITVYSKGLEVKIWVEKGLLFALTEENDKN